MRRFIACMMLGLIMSIPVPLMAEESFHSLSGKLKELSQFDFKALRLSYTKTPDYNPYGGDDKAQTAMVDALKAGEYEMAIKYAMSILDKNYVDINAHFVSGIAYKMMNNLEKYNFHEFVDNGLVNSILGSGDGKSPKTAYLVINTREEYIILSVLGLEPGVQSLIESDGHKYDRLEAIDPKTGESTVLYFNVDIPFGWLSQQLK